MNKFFVSYTYHLDNGGVGFGNIGIETNAYMSDSLISEIEIDIEKDRGAKKVVVLYWSRYELQNEEA